MPSEVPSHWPGNIRYLQSSVYHASVSADTSSFLRGSNSRSQDESSRSASLVKIQRIQTASHPAFGQYGLFAAKKITPRTKIIDYVGEVHCDDRPDSDYDLSLWRSPDGTNVGVDAAQMGNQARFVNDFRGISSKANAAFVEERAASGGELKMTIWCGPEAIRKGEEILVSYGKTWWRARSSMEGVWKGCP